MKILLILIATFYSNKFENRKTHSGEYFKQSKFTGASLSIPINSLVKVTNLRDTSKVVFVWINDKCKRKGIIDLSKSAFIKLSSLNKGKLKVKIEII